MAWKLPSSSADAFRHVFCKNSCKNTLSRVYLCVYTDMSMCMYNIYVYVCARVSVRFSTIFSSRTTFPPIQFLPDSEGGRSGSPQFFFETELMRESSADSTTLSFLFDSFLSFFPVFCLLFHFTFFPFPINSYREAANR